MPRSMESNEAEGDSRSVSDDTTDDRAAGSASFSGRANINVNSLFSPASVMTDQSSIDDQLHSSFAPATTQQQQAEAGLPAVELFETNVSGADLPEYSTGAQITRAPTEPEQSTLSRLNQHLHHHHAGDDDRVTSALTIRVDRTKFSLGDIIQGTIMFVPWRKKDNDGPQAISGVNVLLLAQETTYSNPSSNTSVACSRTYKLGYHIVPEMAMPPDGTVSAGYIYTFPFSVQVPNVKVSPEEECKCDAHTEHARLAPPFSRPGVKIEYQLCAMVRGPQVNTLTAESRIAALCRGVRDLEILPSYPPLVVDGLTQRGDSNAAMSVYTAQSKLKFGTALKSLWSSSSGGKKAAAANGGLSLRLSVPTACDGSRLRLALDRAYSTLLPLELEFAGTGVPSVQRTSLELRSTTRYLVSRKLGSLDQARATPKLAATAIRTATETVVLAQHEMKSGCQFVESATGRLAVSVSIPLAWDPAALLSSTAMESQRVSAPTATAAGAAAAQTISASFKTCFVEHEHELELKVFVAGGVAMKKNVCVSLKVPLEIVATA